LAAADYSARPSRGIRQNLATGEVTMLKWEGGDGEGKRVIHLRKRKGQTDLSGEKGL